MIAGETAHQWIVRRGKATLGGISGTLIAFALCLGPAGAGASASAPPAFLSHPAKARQVGPLDRSFGHAGRVATELRESSWQEAGVRVAADPDGSIVAAGGNLVARYLPNGRLDTGFGEGGVVTITEQKGLSFQIADVAVDAAGRVVVFATGSGAPYGYISPYPYGPLIPRYSAVLRFDPAGRPDPTFAQNGAFLSDLGLPIAPGFKAPSTHITGGAIDSEDRIVLIAASEEIAPACPRSTFQAIAKSVVRLTPSGQLDPSFGEGDGSMPLPDVSPVVSLAVGEDDGLLLAGGFSFGGPYPCNYKRGSALIRVGPDGRLDPGFQGGIRRYVRTGKVEAAAVDGRGRILLLGQSRAQGNRGTGSAAPLMRLTPDGNADPSFGRQGLVGVRLENKRSQPTAVAVGAGRIWLIETHYGPIERPPYYSLQRVEVKRLLPSGSPDRSFGSGGSALISFRSRTGVTAHAAFVDPSGRLVVAGSFLDPNRQWLSGFALLRFRPVH